MNVLSLFDGISCGMLGLNKANIQVDRYVAYEIDKYAVKISKNNFPEIEHMGDVVNANFADYKDFDLVIAGSPCQDLSNYKFFKDDVKGLDGDKSKLFYFFVKALRDINPKFFLFENVASMRQVDRDIITQELGVEPVYINSSDVCACERPRLYWTNIPIKNSLSKKNIMLKDIVLNYNEVPEKYWYKRSFQYNGNDKKVEATLLGSGLMRNMRECYNLNYKCNTLLCDGDGGNRQKKVFQNGRCRKLMPIEYERLQTIPDNYTSCVSDSRRYTVIGNAWTVDIISYLFSGLS